MREVIVMSLPLAEKAREQILARLPALRRPVPFRSPHYRYEELFVCDEDSAAISFPLNWGAN
jgi:hypothetical protein